MRILLLEIKRVLKTKSTLVLAGAAVLLSFFLVVNVIQGERIYDRDFNKLYSGIEAVKAGHEIDAPNEGLVLPERLLDSNERYSAVVAQYGGSENIPEDVYREQIWRLREYVNLVGAVSIDPETGFTVPPEERRAEDILNFYENRDAFIAQKLAEKDLKHDPIGQANALAINARVETPFVFYSYRGWMNGSENIAILIFLITILCATIAAPVFSNEYQTGSDHILRCTKHGRTRLAVCKLFSATLISICMFALCMLLIFGILCATLGTDGLKTSVQMSQITSIAPLTFGSVNLWVILAGALTLAAVVCFTMFISASFNKPITVLIISVVVILLPTIMRQFVGGNLAGWIRFCLPSGGTGFGNSIFYELLFSTTFLRVGSFSIWAPYIITASAAINIVIFGVLTVYAYKRHEAV